MSGAAGVVYIVPGDNSYTVRDKVWRVMRDSRRFDECQRWLDLWERLGLVGLTVSDLIAVCLADFGGVRFTYVG